MTKTTEARTDAHRPSAIIPADYTYVGVFYQGASEDEHTAYGHDHVALGDALTELGYGTDEFTPDTVAASGNAGNYAATGRCDLCGTAFAHGVVFRHTPTGELVVLGHICAGDVGLGMDEASRRRMLNEREAKRAKTAAANVILRAEFLAAHPDVAAIFTEWAEQDDFVADVYRRWHSDPAKGLSDKQAEALLKVPARRAEWAERDAAKAQAEAEAAANAVPVPTDGKRREVVGTILSTRWDDTQFGQVRKMLLLSDEGYKLWGTVPSALNGTSEWDDEGRYVELTPTAQAGDKVRFVAKLEASDDDPAFGFYARPTKAEVVEAAQVAEAPECEHAPYFAEVGECAVCDAAR